MKRFSSTISPFRSLISNKHIVQRKTSNPLYISAPLPNLETFPENRDSTVIFVTGCNTPYFNAWITLYRSIKANVVNPVIYFFDLGISKEEKDIIDTFDVIYEYFNFDLYPDWVNVRKDAGQWAWKAQCIKQVMEKYDKDDTNTKYLVWCDARNIVDNNLESLKNFLDKNGVYTNITSGNVNFWTVKQTIDYFTNFEHIDAKKYLNYPMRNAALPCFNINMEWVRNFINEFARLSLIKDCIFPVGSSVLNHRQDQSVLTILYYKYKDEYKFQDSNNYEGIRVHTVPIKKPYVHKRRY